jgi:PAS domain S-box-containing protein
VERAVKPRRMTAARRAFLHWLAEQEEGWLSEWTETILRTFPSYAGLSPEDIRQPVARHAAALREVWATGDQGLLLQFYEDLARRRLSDQIRLADLSRAVTVGERLLLERLEDARLEGKGAFRALIEETFREGTYVLLEAYQRASEDTAESARVRIAATEAGAAKAREEWQLLDQILSVMEVGIVLLDKNLRVTWLNHHMPREILLVEPERAVGRPCREVLKSEALDCEACSTQGSAGVSSTMRVIKRVGTSDSVKEFLKIIRVVSGTPVGGPHLMEIYLDISAQQEVSRTLARTQELVRNILNSSVDGIISTDTQGRITLFNRAAERIFGYTEAEVLGRRVREFYEGGAEEAARVMIKLYADEVLSDHRATIIAKSGELVPLRVSASLLRDEERTILGTMASFQDLRVEEALKQEMASRDQFFVSVMQASMDGLVTLDDAGRIVSWNRGATAIFGLEPVHALGRSMDDFLPPSLIRELPSSAAARTGTHQFEVSLDREGDEGVDLLVTRTEISGRQEARGSSLVLKDVTELKRLQRDLAMSENLAELGRLAASVAHEIKNPIAGLRGAMEMMSGVHQPDDPRFAVFQEALAQMRRLDSLVKDLLSFAKPVAVRREATPLGLVLEACMPFVVPNARESGVRLDIGSGEDLPEVLADPQQLQQVFVNLLLNAVQATPNDGLVSLSHERRNGFLAVSVTDTGCGITPELRSSIFKPFFTTKHIGTGLGLSIVQRIVNAHGGRIEIQSEAGAGSTFTVLLPIAAGSS